MPHVFLGSILYNCVDRIVHHSRQHVGHLPIYIVKSFHVADETIFLIWKKSSSYCMLEAVESLYGKYTTAVVAAFAVFAAGRPLALLCCWPPLLG